MSYFFGHFLLAITIAGLVLSGVFIYLIVRNNKVFSFRVSIIELCYEYNIRHLHEGTPCANEWFFRRLPTYEQMLFSLKPLKIELWADNKEIEKLLN